MPSDPAAREPSEDVPAPAGGRPASAGATPNGARSSRSPSSGASGPWPSTGRRGSWGARPPASSWCGAAAWLRRRSRPAPSRPTPIGPRSAPRPRGVRGHAGGSRLRRPAERPAGSPACLFQLGRPLAGTDDRVAIVGARRCSRAGREVAISLGRALVLSGLSVVSGAAHGIDAAAHDGALRAGGRTVAVLGSGIDVLYPASSRSLLEEVAATARS